MQFRKPFCRTMEQQGGFVDQNRSFLIENRRQQCSVAYIVRNNNGAPLLLSAYLEDIVYADKGRVAELHSLFAAPQEILCHPFQRGPPEFFNGGINRSAETLTYD